MSVYDFLYGGTTTDMATFECELQAAFSVGPIASRALVYIGLAVSCAACSEARPPSVWVHQQAHVDCMDDISIPAERLKTVEAAVTSSELMLYRRVTGALLWAAGQTLPHMA